jgi:general secretion pathway protein J
VTRAAADSRNAGFTLVEALVATLLMGFILAALATVTGQWVPGWNRGFAGLQRTQFAAEGLDRLTDDLAEAEFITTRPGNAQPGNAQPGNAQAGNAPPLFDGSELSVVFVRTRLAPNGGLGLEVVRLAETGSDNGPALVRSTAPLPFGSSQSADVADLVFSDPVVVIRAPYRVSFSYAGADRVWQDNWHAQQQLPRAVRVQVRDNATSDLLAVSTSTLIHAELAARCSWGTTAQGCPSGSGPAQNTPAPANSNGGL